MTLHLVKLCVGAASIEDLAAWQASNRKFKTRDGKLRVYHPTFQTPKRTAELLSGGSLYWVIRGLISVRQPLAGFEEGKKDDGSSCCHIMLMPELVPVRPTPRRAFQGWRYFAEEDAPPDLAKGARGAMAAMPADMRRKLADLGLL